MRSNIYSPNTEVTWNTTRHRNEQELRVKGVPNFGHPIMLPRVSAHRRHLIGGKCTLNWVGIDQPMKMSASSRGVDKELHVNNNLLQTLPKKDTSIRRAFIPSDEYELWMMDLDQVIFCRVQECYSSYILLPSKIGGNLLIKTTPR